MSKSPMALGGGSRPWGLAGLLGLTLCLSDRRFSWSSDSRFPSNESLLPFTLLLHHDFKYINGPGTLDDMIQAY